MRAHSCLIFFVFIGWTQQLQPRPGDLLLQLMNHLENPRQLLHWENHAADPCTIPSSTRVSISCFNGAITELQIIGDKPSSTLSFHGHAIPNKTLSSSFSIDAFSSTLAKFPKLKAVTLVSLGIWGRLPDNIHSLKSLQLLDLSSNFLYGSIPKGLSRLPNLHSLVLDGNYFNGTLPLWFNSMNLLILSGKRNRFSGHLPRSLCEAVSLTNLALSHNMLDGNLPDLTTLSNLRTIDLRGNKFSSELPSFPRLLVTALISDNSFTGRIPKAFRELKRLQHLDLSNNRLSGNPPPFLFTLPSISYLDLSSNKLTGVLPRDLQCGRELQYVDVSYNGLAGEVPYCFSNGYNKRAVKFGENCFLASDQIRRTVFCGNEMGGTKRERGWIVIAVGSAILLGVLGFGVTCICRRRRCRRKTERNIYVSTWRENVAFTASSDYLANARFIAKTSRDSPSYKGFQFEELKEATNNFDLGSLIGEGYIGKLYKGKLKNDTFVAIRSLFIPKKQSLQGLKVKLNLLSKLRHPHLVTLLGHCIHIEDDRVFLVYEFLPLCNYRSHLAETSPEKALKWTDRLAVLIGVAKAVHFLHTGVVPGTVNNRLKTNNILFDEHRIAKLNDYGIAILTEENESTVHRVNLEDDVYNFGFILLESLVGSIPSGKGEAFLLIAKESLGSNEGRKGIIDPVVLESSSQECLSIAIELTRKCISGDASSRPSFEDVLWNLQYAAQVQATHELDLKPDCS